MIKIVEETNRLNNGFLKCSECGREGFKNLNTHIVKVHHMTVHEYKEKYPDDTLFLDELRDGFSAGGYNANKVMRDSGLDFSERSRKARATELKNDPEAYLKRNRRLYDDPEFRKRAAERVMKVSKWHRDRYYYVRPSDGTEFSFRSSWEVTFAEWLDENNISYEYETLKFFYKDPNTRKEKTYYPDFYLKDLNLIIEVKPKCFVNDPSVVAKQMVCEEKGYKFKFITQDDLKNLSTKTLNV